MFKKILIPACFVLILAAQWYVPADMVMQSKTVITKGTLMRFKCAPVDPKDPFRGSYIVLSLDNRDFTLPPNHDFSIDEKVYVLFETDSAGFARIKAVEKKKPHAFKEVLETKIDYISNENGKPVATIAFPFSRFYMEEFKAPVAEKMYNDAVLTDTGNTYALVHIYYGKARVSNVVLKGKLLTEWFNNKPSKLKP
jgi:uncharacterized membrane-anchored protein